MSEVIEEIAEAAEAGGATAAATAGGAIAAGLLTPGRPGVFASVCARFLGPRLIVQAHGECDAFAW